MTDAPSASSSAATPSPNIWDHPEIYEIENRAVDPYGAIWAAMQARADWSGRRVLDIGCGSGFHLPLLAQDAAQVIGVEPHAPLVSLARERVADLPGVHVIEGAAQQLPLADSSVDVVHARWAYFFGPGCEEGLAELERVVAPGGTAFVIDNDTTRSTFGEWCRRAHGHDTRPVAKFWAEQGWQCDRVDMEWAFDARGDLEAVVGIEFPPAAAEQFLGEHDGLHIDYAVNLYSRQF